VKTNRYDHMSETELLDLYYAGKDQQWLGILLERYTLLLLGVCMKYLKNEAEAKDAVQQVFLKVLTEAAKYRISYFKSWIYMVAKNHCLMKLRSNPARRTTDIERIDLPAGEEKKEEWQENEKTYTLLEESLEELSPEQKDCVILFYLKKNSYQQISERTGFSPMQVKSYIQNGKRNLKMLLEKKMQQTK
jgi:RNA polymerase sigma factor (sigma-70 family)